MRRYVADAGPLLPRLHKLVRADCTTRNKRRAAMLQANYDGLERRIAELAAQEDLAWVRPDLDGNEIMRSCSAFRRGRRSARHGITSRSSDWIGDRFRGRTPPLSCSHGGTPEGRSRRIGHGLLPGYR